MPPRLLPRLALSAVLALTGCAAATAPAGKPAATPPPPASGPAGTTAPAGSPALAEPVAPAAPAMVTLPSGLQYQDLRVGDGNIAETGLTVLVHYNGWLTNGRKFDSSVDRGQPYQFKLGAGRVIRGWDEGIPGMRIGGRRKLIVPASLGFGAQGSGSTIPPNATLVFEIDLLDLR